MPAKPETEQAQLAAQFREECLAEGIIKPESEAANDEYLLRRFLRARQYDFKQSKIMLKNAEDWRAKAGGKGMDELYRELDPFDYPERAEVFQYWPLFFHKTDKKGRPINIHRFGGINGSELMKHVSPERFTDILTVNCEALTREILPGCAIEAGKPIETVLVIVDLKGFGISQFWGIKDMVRQSFQISQDYYPETMGHVCIINAPMGFSTVWSAVKPWLAKETVDKIEILGSKYEDTLLSFVDAENLPASLGGSCTCAECGGCDQSNEGPWVQGRAERRAAWLRRERPTIALTAKDVGKAVASVDEDKTVEGPSQMHSPTQDILDSHAGSQPAASTTELLPASVQEPSASAVAPPVLVQSPESEVAPSAPAAEIYPEGSIAALDASRKGGIEILATSSQSLPMPPATNMLSLPGSTDPAAAPRAQSVPPSIVSETAPAPTPATAPVERDFSTANEETNGTAPVATVNGDVRSSLESATAVDPSSGAVSPTSTTYHSRSRKSKKSIGSIFSARSRESSVDTGAGADSPRKSRIKGALDKVADKLKIS